MSLSTLLEAAQYLAYLDSNKDSPTQQQLTNHAHQYTQSSSLQIKQQTQPTIAKKSTRRQRSSRKDAANTMLAMSLPTSSNTMQVHQGVPIPLASSSGHHNNHAASLSSSFTTESPLSSFASTALLCSKTSGITSASSSSAASSLSSSDSSSSCGEILMGDNDFNQPPASGAGSNSTNQLLNASFSHQDQQRLQHKSGNDKNQSFAHYIAATSTGPQLVTMTATSSGGITSASAPIDGRIRAGHVIHAAANNANIAAATGMTGGFDPRQFSLTTASGIHRGNDFRSRTFGLGTSLGSDNHLNSSPGTCPPLIMARVQPMILNSLSPPAHQSIVAFQQQQHHHPSSSVTASSPTSSSSSYSRHRELHKTLEKNRRAHLRHCFELLKSELPTSECVDKKTSHINIIKSAIRYVLALRQQECEIDSELQRLSKIKSELTEKLATMRIEPKQQLSSQATSHHLSVNALIIASSSSSSSTSPPSTQQQHQQLPISPAAGSVSTNTLNDVDTKLNHLQHQQQQPVAEQQLSFLLSQSKID